ncbi:flagellar basal body L-ring protein FlgH [Fretibacterium sp. OH1220_COT-178]|uniref:flagellar basal body L-ring protein FlgH n=1 Tax=Fretibacterium sp. OH1220_COT-178 TaxID=2491047 RepID=UPI001F211477|nr:flagellar basal body L-ring protein FlgH [Fretibacterium sp. OH1220_COT-178]
MKKAKGWIRTAFLLLLFCCAAVGPAPEAKAASLWDDRTNWMADERPGRVGDIVTVLVNERTDAKDEATMDVKKSSNSSVSDGTGILNFIRRLTLTSDNSSKGDGSVERKHHARATVACLVTDVLPNGNLVIEGTRDVRTSEETLQFQLVGVIRPQDVNSNNQIRSELIANAELAVKGKGVISRTQKPGIITQILQAVF